MEINETTYTVPDKAPAACTYCGEERDFLMLKPQAMAYKGDMMINVFMRKDKPWTCLQCFALDIDAAGHSVDVYEYDQEADE